MSGHAHDVTVATVGGVHGTALDLRTQALIFHGMLGLKSSI
jgi:hypothetical protein